MKSRALVNAIVASGKKTAVALNGMELIAMDRLDEIRARCEAAKEEKRKGNAIDCACLSWAVVLNDVPYLLAEIERLQAENKRLDIEDAKDALRGDTLRGELQKMTARAEKAEAERDATICRVCEMCDRERGSDNCELCEFGPLPEPPKGE